MRRYEVMFIVRPDASEEEVDKLIAQMQGVVSGAGGKVEKVDKMGRRRLAYRIARHLEGFYVLFTLEDSGPALHEMERRLKVADSVIRFISVRIEEEQKKVEKLKALRAKAEARRPRAKAAAPAPAAPPAADAPRA